MQNDGAANIASFSGNVDFESLVGRSASAGGDTNGFDASVSGKASSWDDDVWGSIFNEVRVHLFGVWLQLISSIELVAGTIHTCSSSFSAINSTVQTIRIHVSECHACTTFTSSRGADGNAIFPTSASNVLIPGNVARHINALLDNVVSYDLHSTCASTIQSTNLRINYTERTNGNAATATI
ncbi:hypothetical protein MPER_08905 [Moniliophthora perniciosa FA553]|nr:hypothetical protein MPER_08905 [Moniliophthora perniciosa FA553]